MNERAAIYARVSSERQAAEDKVSIEMQLADSEEYCRSRGYAIVGQYVDSRKYRSKGRLVEPSGTRSDRPEYKAMLKAAYDGEFNVIVAWKEDRLCRGIYAAVPLGRVLEDTPVKVDLVKEAFDVNMFFIKAAIGKIEVDNIKERMHMGVQGRLDKGRVWDQHKRYGYEIDEEGHLIIDEERGQWVVQIYAWYLEGVPLREIRRRLVEADAPIPNRKSGPKEQKVPWPMSTLHHILTSSEYWRGFTKARRNGKVYKISCPPIIDRETFEQVQALRKQNQSHAESLVKNDYLCLGLITCADSRRWGARTVKWRKKGVPRKKPLGRYYCEGKGSHPEVYNHPDCPKTVGSKKLDDFVWEQVSGLLARPELVREALEAEIERLRQAELDIEAELERLQKDLDDLAMERQWVITQARKGKITGDDMDLQLGALALQESVFLKEQAEKSSLAIYRERAKDIAKFTEEYLSGVRAGLIWLSQDIPSLDAETGSKVFEERRRVVKMLVDRIVMHKGMPPEVIYGIDLPDMVSGDYNGFHAIGNASCHLVFSLYPNFISFQEA